MKADELAVRYITQRLAFCRENNIPLTDELLANHITGAVLVGLDAARKERDMEWWEKCCLVDNVSPTPEGVQGWIATENGYATQCERERVLAIIAEHREAADKGGRMTPNNASVQHATGVVKNVLARVEDRIKSGEVVKT